MGPQEEDDEQYHAEEEDEHDHGRKKIEERGRVQISRLCDWPNT
jgi:hypothetical protein